MYYKEKYIVNDFLSFYEYLNYKYELFLSDGIEYKEYSFILEKDFFLPIAAMKKKVKFPPPKITIRKELKTIYYQLENYDRWNYLFLEKGEYHFHSDIPFIVGKPVVIENHKNLKYKLVLMVFVDGITGKVLHDGNYEEYMPHTKKFFEDGVVCKNAFSNSEWTLPSLRNIFLGQYTSTHGLFHAHEFHSLFDIDTKPLNEYFQDEGYFTFQINSNPRATPSYGFTKGYDRVIYKDFMCAHEVVSETIEQLETFKQKEQFGWISFLDTHNSCGNSSSIYESSQMNVFNQENWEQQDENIKSHFKKFSNEEKDKYLLRIRQTDQKMQPLYDYIESNYQKNEYMICFFSDHGVSIYDEKDNFLLSEQKIRVPLMFKGDNLKPTSCEEFIENVDILPTLLSLCDIKLASHSDGNIPKSLGGDNEREFVFSESKHSGKQTYKATVISKESSLQIETKDFVDPQSGYINLDNYRIVSNKFEQSEVDNFEKKYKIIRSIVGQNK